MEDVDLFAKTDETDVAQNNGNEEDEEEDLFAIAKGSSEAQMTGFSIFDNNDKEDLDDEDINKLFIPAGADENKISLEIEDNSQLLKWVLTSLVSRCVFGKERLIIISILWQKGQTTELFPFFIT